MTDDERELAYAEQEADFYGRWIYMGDYIRRLRKKVYGAVHEAAVLWDRRHMFQDEGFIREDGDRTPVGRPCDWCGRRVEKGYIHDECFRVELVKYEPGIMEYFYGPLKGER